MGLRTSFKIYVETIRLVDWLVGWLVGLGGWPLGEYNLYMERDMGDDSLEFLLIISCSLEQVMGRKNR